MHEILFVFLHVLLPAAGGKVGFPSRHAPSHLSIPICVRSTIVVWTHTKLTSRDGVGAIHSNNEMMSWVVSHDEALLGSYEHKNTHFLFHCPLISYASFSLLLYKHHSCLLGQHAFVLLSVPHLVARSGGGSGGAEVPRS